MCPQLQEPAPAGVFQAQSNTSRSQQNQQYNPYSNTYNPGWRDHPNLRYRPAQTQPLRGSFPPPQQHQFQPQVNQYPQQQQRYVPPPLRNNATTPLPTPTQPQGNATVVTEDLVKQIADRMAIQMAERMSAQIEQNVTATIQDLKTQLGQLATEMNEVKQQGFGKLPSQPMLNPHNNECHYIEEWQGVTRSHSKQR